MRSDKIVFSDEKMFRFGESGLSAQNCRVQTKVSRKRDLKPSKVALEGDKFMNGIMVAAGATLDGGVWSLRTAFCAFHCEMASPEYHGLLAHHYSPKATAQIGMDFVMCCSRQDSLRVLQISIRLGGLTKRTHKTNQSGTALLGIHPLNPEDLVRLSVLPQLDHSASPKSSPDRT